MKKVQFTHEQIIGTLAGHQAGATALCLGLRDGNSDATFTRGYQNTAEWRCRKHGGFWRARRLIGMTWKT